MEIRNLTHLQEGETAKVAGLKSSGAIRRRFQELGLVGGTDVRCLRKGPHGDPVAYGFRGVVIALRAEDAAGVTVQ